MLRAQEAEYLERCWLLLADIYVASNKPDLATDLLKRTISHNKARTNTTQHTYSYTTQLVIALRSINALWR